LLARLGWVSGLIPPQFEAYAQVGLPAWEAPLQENGLDPKALAVLCERIGERYSVSDCWFRAVGGLRMGSHWPRQPTPDHRGRSASPGRRPALCPHSQSNGDEPTFPVEVLEGPKLRLPHREYLVFRGPLMIGEHHFGWFEAHAPDLLWPEDRAWFIATDTDLSSVYVGGSARLIADILDEDRLAAVVVQPRMIRYRRRAAVGTLSTTTARVRMAGAASLIEGRERPKLPKRVR
jgi:hypothetical protein